MIETSKQSYFEHKEEEKHKFSLHEPLVAQRRQPQRHEMSLGQPFP
jgi:hypothetical protein